MGLKYSPCQAQCGMDGLPRVVTRRDCSIARRMRFLMIKRCRNYPNFDKESFESILRPIMCSDLENSVSSTTIIRRTSFVARRVELGQMTLEWPKTWILFKAIIEDLNLSKWFWEDLMPKIIAACLSQEESMILWFEISWKWCEILWFVA